MTLTYAQKFVGGMLGILGVTVLVNLTLITLASTTNDGLVTEHYYKHGLRYDEERARELNKPGWRVSLAAPRVAGKTAPVVVTLADSRQAPLSGARVNLKLYRPTRAGYDQLVPMRETARGRFEAQVNLPLEGLWDATVAIEKAGDRYDHRERLRLEAPRS